MKSQLLLSIFLMLFFIKSNSQINLVKDVIAGTSGSSPDKLTDVNGTLFFTPSLINGASNQELWKSDGTSAGTTLVKILPFFYLTQYISFNGSLFISGEGGFWKSDGTNAGTVLLNANSAGGTTQNMFVYNNKLYFHATYSGISGIAKSDGTSAGTNIFAQNVDFRSPVVSGQYLYFISNTTASGAELWRTDGTVSGTVMVKDINTGVGLGGNLEFLKDVNGTLYFMANDGINGQELWKSDGTAVGTVMVKDITSGSVGTPVDYFTNVNGTLYFTTDYNSLWKSDGTAAGTVIVKNVTNIQFLTNVDGTLFFAAASGVYSDYSAYGSELWKSDGTSAGTIMIKDVQPGTNSSGIQEATAVGSTLYFSAINATYGRELWKSDGTEAGTTLVQDRNVGTVWFTPKKLILSGTKLFMTGTTATEGLELFVYENINSSLKENSVAKNVSIYPNPNNGNFTIEMQEFFENPTIEICNSMGQRLYSQAIYSSKKIINLNLKAGIYLINVSYSNGKIQTKKVIVK